MLGWPGTDGENGETMVTQERASVNAAAGTNAKRLAPNPLCEAAVDYATRLGWRIVPNYEVGPDGLCSCAARANCANPGKHPRLSGWPDKATSDERQIRHWWREWPNSPVGVATGAGSRIFALDVDPRHGGDGTLRELEASYGELPPTVINLTGGGGCHYVFEHPGGTVPNVAGGALGPGLDIRGDGGQILVEPSPHASGRQYAWDAAGHPFDMKPAPAPGWILALLAAKSERKPAGAVAERIPEGGRNAALASLAGTMRRRGMGEREICAALLVTNSERCDPPLPVDEVEKIAASIARYEPRPDLRVSLPPRPATSSPAATAPATDAGTGNGGTQVEGTPAESPAEHRCSIGAQQKSAIIYGTDDHLCAPEDSAASLVTLADVQPEEVRWLWPRRLPRGKLTLVDGDPGLGKSLITLDLAARVSRGWSMPDGAGATDPAGVVLLGAEDDLADTIRPRLDAAGADVTRIGALTGVRRTLESGAVTLDVPTVGDLEALRDAIARVHAALVVIDPLMAYLPGAVDSHRDQDVRRSLAPLAALAAETGCSVLVVRHLNKAGMGSALYRGGGSIGIIGAARCGLLVGRDPDDESGERRILAVTKSNLAAIPPALAYRLQTAGGAVRVEWLGECEQTADTLVCGAQAPAERSALREARAWLRDVLGAGPMPARDVQAQARQAGIAEPTLRRARQEERVQVIRSGFGPGGQWTWQLPDGTGDHLRHRCSSDPIDDHVSELGTNEHLCGEAGADEERI